jgi:hypothetical protein
MIRVLAFRSALLLLAVGGGVIAVAVADGSARLTRLREGQQCSRHFAHRYRAHGFQCRFGLLVSQWRPLERPLRLLSISPGSPCPITPRSRKETYGSAVGAGPAYAANYAASGPPVNDVTIAIPPPPGSAFAGSHWNGWKHVFLVADRYFGRIVIRGRQLDGSGGVRFGPGLLPATELRIEANVHETRTFTRVTTPGCYGYQVDGRRFTETIVFRVRAASA